MKKAFYPFIILVFLTVGIFLRFSEAIIDRDFWYDEAFTGILLKQSWSQMNQMIFADVHPPLYYWLAKSWGSVFGYGSVGIRSFSAFFGLLTIVSIYWIGSRMFGKKTGLLAAAITTFSPFAIEYSQEARMYSLFGFLMLWAVWFFYKAIIVDERQSLVVSKKNKFKNLIKNNKYWLLWGLFAGLSFYTHYLSLFFFMIFFAAYVSIKYLASRLCQKEDEKQEKTSKSGNFLVNFFKSIFPSKGFWLGTGVIVLFFASWIKIFIRHISKGNLGWIEPSQLSDIPKTLQIFFFGHPAGTGGIPWPNEFRYFFDSTSAGLMIFLSMLTLFVIISMKISCNNQHSEKKSLPDYYYAMLILAIMSFGTLVFLILLSHIDIKLYVARYFMPAAIMIYLLFSALVLKVFSSRYSWLIFLVVYLAMIAMLKPFSYSHGWSQLYQQQKEVLGCCDLVVTSNPFDYSTARYYFGKDIVRYYNRNNPTEDFSGWVVVGNENRITDLDIIKKHPEMVVVDGDCRWEGLNVQEKKDFGQISACKLER
jgi:uncharacterized membrane protein